MLESSTKSLLEAKYGIDINKYRESDQLEILKRLKARNDKIIDINNEKISLLSEIVTDMSNYINGGGKVATK